MNTAAIGQPMQFSITLEENAMVSEIKRAIKMIKGISAVKLVRSKTPRKSGIELALDDVKKGRVKTWSSVDDMFNTLLK